jgi:hypothetical protein
MIEGARMAMASGVCDSMDWVSMPMKMGWLMAPGEAVLSVADVPVNSGHVRIPK